MPLMSCIRSAVNVRPTDTAPMIAAQVISEYKINQG
jgi:hypothetical protein